MTEKPSNTSNHQRLNEMFIHLTPRGATIPYSLCVDNEHNMWVASKGGLFKFDAEGKSVLFERRNPFPKKISPYCQVLHHDGKIIYAFAEDRQITTELRIFDLEGGMLHEQFIDGKLFSLVISQDGDLFMTKQPMGEDSIIYKTSVECPLGWEEVVSEDEYAFQSLCVLDPNTLLTATCSVPLNMYSKQALRIVDVSKQSVVKTFSVKGKEDGQIFFPRSIQRYGEDVVVMDKTGRFQRFTREGNFVGVVAKIDSYLGNGFIVEHDRAVIACSGIVLNAAQETVCDDWIERIALDGSCWTPIVDNPAA